MIHTKDEVLALSSIMAKKIIDFENKCRNQEHTSDALKCHELSEIASMARLVTSDTGDIGDGC